MAVRFDVSYSRLQEVRPHQEDASISGFFKKLIYNLMRWGEQNHWKLFSTSQVNSSRVSAGNGNILARNPDLIPIIQECFDTLFDAKKLNEIFPEYNFSQEDLTCAKECLIRIKGSYDNALNFVHSELNGGTCFGQSQTLLNVVQDISNADEINTIILKNIKSVFIRQMAGIVRMECYRVYPSLVYALAAFDFSVHKELNLEKGPSVPLEENSSSYIYNQIKSHKKCSAQINVGLGHAMYFYMNKEKQKYYIQDSNSGVYTYSSDQELARGILDISISRNRSPMCSKATFIDLYIRDLP